MKDILKDIVSHVHGTGFLPLVKVTGEDGTVSIDSIAEDRSVVLNAVSKVSIPDFSGVFGMPDLHKLSMHLKNPEYETNEKISVVFEKRNNTDVPVKIHFENANGDFKNDYRFMQTEIINEKFKTVKFKGATWNVEFTPSVTAISRLKLQAAVHTEEKVFQVKTENKNLVFSFGDGSGHTGNFIFETNIKNDLKHHWSWPVVQTLTILNLDGDKNIKISDSGVMLITVDSGIMEYRYYLPAQSK
jgi:hypothetical protein